MTVGQKTVIIILVISIIAVIFCGIKYYEFSDELRKLKALTSTGQSEYFDRADKVQHYIYLYAAGVIVSIILLVVSLILVPSVNRNAKLKHSNNSENEVYIVKNINK